MAPTDSKTRAAARIASELLVRAMRSFGVLGISLLVLALFGCASLPPPAGRTPALSLSADEQSPLVRAAARELPEDRTQSGLRLLADGAHALEARLTLISRATRSLDLQTYHLADDGTGRLVAQALARAAARGVRVRLLVDDLYSENAAGLMDALASTPNIEVRVFNPLPVRAGSVGWRLALSLHEFGRINHRMHNKLFLADGAFAVAGGRNVADEYYMRSAAANFVDMDVLATGPVVRELAAVFDGYWNSELAWAWQRLQATAGRSARPIDPEEAEIAGRPDPGPDRFGAPSLRSQLDQGRLKQVFARVSVMADPAAKALAEVPAESTTQGQAVREMARAEHSLLIVSPYFIPDEHALQMLDEAEARQVQVTVLTNSLAATDEPAVHSGYARYRQALLKMGVALNELGASLVREARVPEVARGSLGRLHAKLAVVDGRRLIVGSMNMDRRSGRCNTEMALLIDSPELAAQLVRGLEKERGEASYRLRLAAGDGSIEWVQGVAGHEEVTRAEPESSTGMKVKSALLSLFVSEDLL